MQDKFLFVASLAESLINFRGPLIAAIQNYGFSVHVAAPNLPKESPVRAELERLGVTVHEIHLQRAGMKVLTDLHSLVELFLLMRRIRPRYLLTYTIKPVIYGSLAGWFAKVPRRFALITGLGYAFQGGGARSRLLFVVERLYSVALAHVEKVFFQNPDDRSVFIERGILQGLARAVVVNGSGVDVSGFVVSPMPRGAIRFLLIARLLGDKGVREYVAAAERVKRVHPDVVFSLVGWIDENPDAISEEELTDWRKRGIIDFLGKLSDVRPAIAASNVYVLPSYREGTPRTVLEAMAMGRAIITTDAPGCRETVVDGHNGFLVPVKSVDALEYAMSRFIEAPELVEIMGERSRIIAETKYDVKKVNFHMAKEMGVV